jgi:HD-GYP domain-containing protein (c-di-GMP phosphodiesterase class II)
MKMDESYVGTDTAHSFQSIDAAVAPVRSVLRNVFLIAAMGGLCAALALGAFSSRSVVKPLASLISHLRQSEKTGMLGDLGEQPSTIHEIRELTESFKSAAAAISQGREKLGLANVEFIGSLASALDARDPYTAGHSRRVSEFSCSIARAADVPRKELEEIRIGALLHDIGKIGIADAVLQKPGKLTAAEFDIIKQHRNRAPDSGGVNGLQQYLPIVELHHENWDGSGYPKGQRGAETPFGARVVHVADAYDAMTSDRPYRPGMDPQKAIRELERHAGTQFDAAIVRVFVEILTQSRKPVSSDYEASLSTALAEAVLRWRRLGSGIGKDNFMRFAVLLLAVGGALRAQERLPGCDTTLTEAQCIFTNWRLRRAKASHNRRISMLFIPPEAERQLDLVRRGPDPLRFFFEERSTQG